MATKDEYAQMSLYVYDAKRLEANRPLEPAGWKTLDYQKTGFAGFSYGIFQRIGSDEVVIAYAGTGDDILIGGGGDDNIDGDAMAAQIRSDWTAVRSVIPDAGGDIYRTTYNQFDVNFLQTGGDDVIYGGAGEDWISAGGGNDYVDGGSDADAIWGEAGSDVIVGGAGNRRLPGRPHAIRRVMQKSRCWRDGGIGCANAASWRACA